jgi:hypothetical protein
LVGICWYFDIYYSGYIQTHCQKNKKIKREDKILPEVYGTTLNDPYIQIDLFVHFRQCNWSCNNDIQAGYWSIKMLMSLATTIF